MREIEKKKKMMNNRKVVTGLRILYPLWMIVGMFSLMYVPSTLIKMDDGVRTIELISNNMLLYRFGMLGSLMTQLLYIIIPLLLFELFSSVDKFQATLLVVFSLVSVPMTMYNELKKMEILNLLDQPDAVLQMFELYYQGINLSSVFWGLWLFPLGILAMKSGYFPKLIGICALLGGVGYFVGSLIHITFPQNTWITSLLEMLTIGEVVFILWLVVAGIRVKSEPMVAIQ